MLNSIEQWVNSVICVGVFMMLIELILPKGNLKKYILVIMGVVTTMTIIYPVISNSNYDEIAKEAVNAISYSAYESESRVNSSFNEEEYLKYQMELVKKEYINNLEKSIFNDLNAMGIVVDMLNVEIAEDYSIKSINIVIEEYLTETFKKSEIEKYLIDYYKINKNIVSITEMRS